VLVAKFIPGLNTAAPSLAGIFRMPIRRFILFDGLGAFFWIATFAGLGFIFSDQLEQIAAHSPLGRLARRSAGGKFGSLHFVEVHPASAFPPPVADRAHHSERTNGQTGRRG
jgi:hypothetical protein